ncbi:hypothetical protein PIB30_074560 [Stylosanthes scabra]|uniref:Uncharacterized protein n=1 Tax=Stylosanthes scabra TaxID=79078 RepID=A0ABU6WMX0_9FABA|nr:hypothetical protein [Stylosanthes scabra]
MKFPGKTGGERPVSLATKLLRQNYYHKISFEDFRKPDHQGVLVILSKSSRKSHDHERWVFTVGGASSSAEGAAGVMPFSSIHFDAPEVSVQMELDCDEESDEDFVGDGRIVAKARMVQSLCRSPRQGGTFCSLPRPNS